MSNDNKTITFEQSPISPYGEPYKSPYWIPVNLQLTNLQTGEVEDVNFEITTSVATHSLPSEGKIITFNPFIIILIKC